MMNLEEEKSQALVVRVTGLLARVRAARITDAELKTFQKVAAVMDNGRGEIAGDDLIAASYLVEQEALDV
ncbi:MAG: hypothetical protein E5V49_13120 [Mesorhizobium sp.]|nr:MAG: hypothetical protein E5V48_11230 [Mesorhizobium sp.]TJW32249.1 MAG: hypothetical protein E5V49_13120 [Mesorhizobium sp.]